MILVILSPFCLCIVIVSVGSYAKNLHIHALFLQIMLNDSCNFSPYCSGEIHNTGKRDARQNDTAVITGSGFTTMATD